MNPREVDSAEVLAELSQTGVDYAIDTTGNAAVVDGMLAALGYRGHAIFLAAANPEAFASVNLSLAVRARSASPPSSRAVPSPQLFVPQLIELYRAGEFPFDRLIRHYPFAQIDDAFRDSEAGKVVKPVLTF